MVVAQQPSQFQRVEGLPHHTVLAITQDRDGFIWLGTADGLVRYDGYEFVVYRHDPTDSSSLSHSSVTALLESEDGRLWVGTEGGLDHLDGMTGRFVEHAITPPGRILGVQALFEDDRGRLWAGLACGVVRYEPDVGRATSYGCEARAEAGQAFYMHQRGPDGSFWAGSSQQATVQGLYRFDPRSGVFQRFPLPASWWPERAVSVAVGPSGRIWTGTPYQAVGWFDPTKKRFERLPFEGGEVWFEDRQGRLWMEIDGGLARYDPAMDQAIRFVLDRGDPGALTRDVRAVFEDRAGTVWAGTLGGLFRYNRGRRFRHISRDPDDPNSLSSNTVMSLHEDVDGTLWVGTFGGGLDRIGADGTVTHFRRRDNDPGGLCDDNVWTLHRDFRGDLWVGTDAGLCRYDPQHDRFVSRPLPADLPYVNTIAEDRHGRLWIGGERLYLLHRDRDRIEQFAPHDTNFRNVQAVHPAAGEVVWLGTEFSGLWRLDGKSGRFKNFPIAGRENGLLGKAVRVVHPAADGKSLWLGTDMGLVRFDLKSESFKHYLEREGLPGSSVFGILEDEKGRLWISTNQGLVRFDPRSESMRTYTSADGTGNTEYNRRAAVAGPTGSFFFGGLEGITSFHPGAVDLEPAAPVVITHVQKAGRSGAVELQPARVMHEGLVLQPHEQAFAIEFAALSFTHPLQNRYAYRLEGFDDDWVDADAHRYARYVGVPPGRYTFRVRSARGGVWNDEGVSVAVVIRPAFWQTGWFLLIIVALALAVLYAGYRYRIAHLLREERLRLRIASDLHDDIGSKLSSIALMTDMVTRRSTLDEQARRRLADVAGTARRMADDLRDIVWMINPRHDRLEDLVAKMQHLATTMLDGTACTFQCPPDVFTETLDMEQRRHLFLVYKEILNNIARHAQASQVAITVEQHDGTFVLKVHDDGVGFDPQAEHLGTGLESVHARALALGGHLAVESLPGAGTTVRLTVKMAESRDGLLEH